FDFTPTFKLWITGNHKPRLDNVDEAIRRRMLLVPFVVQIPAEERDPQLPEKLRAEWSAILRWGIDGCLEWERIGLSPPKVVTDATADYFAEQDLMQHWLDECCVENPSPNDFTSTGDLFASWKTWCDGRNAATGNINSFSDALIERGFVRHKGAKGKR